MKFLAASLVLAASVSIADFGPDDRWQVQFRATDPNGNYGMYFASYGTGDEAYARFYNLDPAKAVIYCTDRGTDRPYWFQDIRPPMAAGTTRTWHLVVKAGANYASSQIKLTGWNQSGPNFDLNGSIPVRLVIVSDPYGSCSPGVVLWECDPNINGTSFQPTFIHIFNWSPPDPQNPEPILLDLVAGEQEQPPIECGIGEARTIYAGRPVSLRGVVVTSTPTDGPGLWLASADGISGLRVETTWNVSRGDRLNVTGVVSWNDGVPVLTTARMNSRTSGSDVRARFASGSSIATDLSETLNYKGMNPIGLLFACCGLVTAVDSAGNVFYIDDGSRLMDG
ncbi:MAG: hypothetical protein N3B12_07300, partial [Armatimonadetes bacterium]|nr:hypothetical protein [Armatimonadota bacterium]